MDFRIASKKLDLGETNHQEITEQILNLPCLYAIYKNKSDLFSLEVYNKENQSNISVTPVYSSLNFALDASNSFEVPESWYIAQWSDLRQGLLSISGTQSDAFAIDSLPEGETLSGLIIDRASLSTIIACV